MGRIQRPAATQVHSRLDASESVFHISFCYKDETHTRVGWTLKKRSAYTVRKLGLRRPRQHSPYLLSISTRLRGSQAGQRRRLSEL